MKVLVSFVRVDGGYRIWVYGLFPEEATSHFKEKFVGVGDYPLCYSERIVPATSSHWRNCKVISISTLMEKFINDYFPEYQKRAVTPYLPYLQRVIKFLSNRRRRFKWVG